jgi:hypothetical protein
MEIRSFSLDEFVKDAVKEAGDVGDFWLLKWHERRKMSLFLKYMTHAKSLAFQSFLTSSVITSSSPQPSAFRCDKHFL